MMDTVISYVIPALTAAVGWLATRYYERRKRKNDFIGDLQKSIDVLSKNYSESLCELVEVKKQNANLLHSQSILQIQMENLLMENQKLKDQVQKLSDKIQKLKGNETD